MCSQAQERATLKLLSDDNHAMDDATDLDFLLECLALAIAADTDLSAFAARAEAQHVYTQAYGDYLRAGGEAYAGFVRWLDEHVSQPTPVTAHSLKTITA